MPRNKTSIPIFCCEKSRNKALEVLTKKFPGIAIKTNSEFGKDSIEINIEEKMLREVTDFIEKELDIILIRFICIN